MNFIQTRGDDKKGSEKVSFSEAILNPSASFGGLWVPEFLPQLGNSFFDTKKSYKQIAYEILKKFEIDIDDDTINEALNLYDNFDDPNDPVPLKKIDENLFVNELYHGPTRAFKDMALQPFGSILSSLAKKQNKKYLILAATSGDTGPAALHSFANKENIKIACLYPHGGTSDVQRLQMVTQDGSNVKVLGVNGNFDDTQHALKSLISSNDFKNDLKKHDTHLSAANSVNFGRIIFQIIYHISAYAHLLQSDEIQNGEEIYVIIPSGNFGNALAAYYAKKMGLPIKKILIASNENNILTDLIENGKYDLNDRELIATSSPAMDILKSSNVERILFDKFGANRTQELMQNLETNGKYELSESEIDLIQEDFEACYSDDEYAKKIIREYASNGYILDPHTATCFKAYENIKGVSNKIVICSTAEWTKFAPTMLNAIKDDDNLYNDKDAIKEILEMTNENIPEGISSLFDKDEIHTDVIEKSEISNKIFEFVDSY